MKMLQRKFLGEDDQQKMIQLAQDNLAWNLRVIDLPYQLSSWALDKPDNIGIWVDEFGSIVAWAVIQTPFSKLTKPAIPLFAYMRRLDSR